MTRNLPGKITREAPPGPTMTAEQFRTALEQQAANAGRWRILRELLGYIEDGSSSVVVICQDDATREWCVTVGSVTNYSQSLDGALRMASKAP